LIERTNVMTGLRDQCAVAVVPFLFKQRREWAPERLTANGGGTVALIIDRYGNLSRPRPREGNWRSRVTTLFLRDKIERPSWPCTRFVREALAYRLAGYIKALTVTNWAQVAVRVSAKRPWLDDGPYQHRRPRKTAGRAATLRSGLSNSWAAIRKSYGVTESGASPLFGGGQL
jgi:hypothetical protein